VNNQVPSASEHQNLRVEAVVMCRLVSDVMHQRVVWYGSMEKCWIHERTEKSDETWRKNLLKCLFTDHKSHTKWGNIQLQLYGQKTSLN